MLNLDTFLSKSLLIRFAEAYNEGSYGGGGYSATNSTTTSPTNPTISPTTQSAPSNTSTPQAGEEAPTATGDQPASSTDATPRATTTQPTTQPNNTPEASTILGMDPITLVISSAVVIATLSVGIVLIVKKITRS
jgi:hypothetical protein